VQHDVGDPFEGTGDAFAFTVGLACLEKLSAAEYAVGGGEGAVEVEGFGEVSDAVVGVANVVACWYLTDLIVANRSENAFCQAVTSLAGPSSPTPTSASGSKTGSATASVTVSSGTVSPAASGSLASIPVLPTSGPGACMGCILEGHFIVWNETTQGLNCSTPDSYSTAKNLVEYFCNASVVDIEPFTSLCNAACSNPCQQYSSLQWLSTEPAFFEQHVQADACTSICPNFVTNGNCHVPNSQFNATCVGLCPGGDDCDGCVVPPSPDSSGALP
jgi:hypothetical protein